MNTFRQKFMTHKEFIDLYGFDMGIAKRTPKKIEKGLEKYCWYNAYKLCINYGYTYCEGIASIDDLSFAHGWCLDFDGKVIDNTIDEVTRYFGVPFDRNYVIDATSRTSEASLIEFDYLKDYELLKGKVGIDIFYQKDFLKKFKNR